MGLLDKFIGSDQRLRQPNFATAPFVEIDFSGTKLRFKDPAHTALFPISDWPSDLNIYEIGGYERLNNGGYSKRFYVKGWDLIGRFNHERGGIITSARIEFHVDQPSAYSCFDKACFESYIFEYCHAVWGRQNKAEKPGELGQGPYKYPVKSSELQYIEVNGIVWCRLEAYIEGKEPAVNYFTPISSRHTIALNIDFDPYKGLDFFSPATNIKEASYQVVENFLQHFYIELSEDSKAQQAATEYGLKTVLRQGLSESVCCALLPFLR